MSAPSCLPAKPSVVPARWVATCARVHNSQLPAGASRNLLFLDQHASAPGTPATVTRSRLEVTVVLIEGVWLISEVRNL